MGHYFSCRLICLLPQISDLPGDQDSGIVVGYAILWNGVPIAVWVDDGLLPFAKAVKGLPSMVVDLQCRLKKMRGHT